MKERERSRDMDRNRKLEGGMEQEVVGVIPKTWTSIRISIFIMNESDSDRRRKEEEGVEERQREARGEWKIKAEVVVEGEHLRKRDRM